MNGFPFVTADHGPEIKGIGTEPMKSIFLFPVRATDKIICLTNSSLFTVLFGLTVKQAFGRMKFRELFY